MARWVIYSTCSIVALCSMGAAALPADLTVPAPSARAEDAARLPTAVEPTDGSGGAAATDRSRRPMRG
ncbi:MAG TPA: hypothetical protein VFZ82_15115 [Methylomirabilota bacterium]|jgi:hypothetical protein|nr:hypothetical protein [Methylomirabilota bacterium]